MASKEMTKAQERAKAKLTNKWQCAYELKESVPTLEGLVARGHAEMKREALGAVFDPRASIYFRLAGA